MYKLFFLENDCLGPHMTSSQMVEFPKEGLRESLDLDAQMA